ncbi:squalene/phytoene synthase family protein [Rhodobacteraceae bacterium 2376]|uniref:Squalene/phytoene synthase family protein n=1 Tax=Rhabdonatronobacter sediminivivens TaxID=2743469 RepID=A0A7Z0HVW9_9RHOB|nr:squalene/phytoene synthase family protein [Rhabdonatronobacter sediminivivens]NYS23356.1 squalene/phytoene synthase family protein [Rhabdonatronobacter sediminivivens]
MSLEACAELVRCGDPDRFLATMAAPPAMRDRLWPIYAANLEIARAPFVTKEPLIAEMRLQFWADTVAEAIAGKAVRNHEVAAPLAEVIRQHDLPQAHFDALIAARKRDISRAPFADTAALMDHMDATAGSVMQLAARVLGADEAAVPVVADMARAAGLANWLGAFPALEAAGQPPLPQDCADPAHLADLGLHHLHRARAARSKVPSDAAPALLSGWQAGAVLHRAARSPERVARGTLASPEFHRRGTLLFRALLRRW